MASAHARPRVTAASRPPLSATGPASQGELPESDSGLAAQAPASERPIPKEEWAAVTSARRALGLRAEVLHAERRRVSAIREGLPAPEAHIQTLVWESETGEEMYPALGLRRELEHVLLLLDRLLGGVQRLAAGLPVEDCPD